MGIAATVGLALLGALLLALIVMAFMDATRGTPMECVVARGPEAEIPAVSDPHFCETVAVLTGTALDPGHDAELLLNGDGTYPRLWQDLREAKTCVTALTYYCNPGTVADTLRDVLCERARAGVEVLFLHDAFGSQLGRKFDDSLRAAGVHVAVLRPIRAHSLNSAMHRSHVRAIVIDGVVGYTGGFGIDDKWLGDGRTNGAWRETNIRLTGPAVLRLQAAFASLWVEPTGELLTGDVYFPRRAPEPDRPVVAGILHAQPTVGSTPAERFWALSIAGARRSLYITNAYFVPDDDFRRLVRQAATRGVDVRILTAGKKTDVKLTRYAGRSTYEELLRDGVRIYEYSPSMVHAKTIVVDGVWCSVGTMNVDNRSMAFNNESNALVYDRTFAERLHAVFFDDLAHAEEITLERFRRRPRIQRPLELGARGLARLL